MTEHIAFVDWMLRRCRDHGTRRLFGVPGGGTSLDVIAAAKNQGLDPVLTAREDAAVIMAGVSGVLGNAPGIAFMTKGPGLASAANGLASASLDRMPVLVLGETFGPGELDYVSHQVFDQRAFVAPLLPRGQHDVLPAAADAVDAWLSSIVGGRRAPAMMFATGEELRRPAVLTDGDCTAGPAVQYLPDDLAEAQHLLARSRSPAVVVGLQAARQELEAPIRRFVESLNAASLTTYMACGTVPSDHANYAGIFTGGAIERDCMEAADLIVLLGLDPVELIRQRWRYDAPVLDICSQAREPHYLEPRLRLEGPLDITLGAFGNTEVGSGWPAADIDAFRERYFSRLEVSAEDGLSPSVVVKTAADVFDGRPRLGVDAGAHMFSACAFWPARKARDILISNGLASMGFAIPACIAAALHDPKRGALAMTGDGGALMCLGELKTAAEVGARICIIVFNDGRLSLIDIKREERQIPDLGLSWQRPDFAAIAAGFGLRTWRVEDAEQLALACREAAEFDGPCLIDARVDSSGYHAQMKALRG